MNPLVTSLVIILCTAFIIIVSVCYGYKAGRQDLINEMREEYQNQLYESK